MHLVAIALTGIRSRRRALRFRYCWITLLSTRRPSLPAIVPAKSRTLQRSQSVTNWTGHGLTAGFTSVFVQGVTFIQMRKSLHGESAPGYVVHYNLRAFADRP